MPETTESARRWSGYVCPDCRFVFRVPRDHDGMGIVCPSCRRMLRIPGVEDTPPPLMAPLRRVTEEDRTTDDEHEGMVKKRRRGRKHRGGGDPSWENQSRSIRSGRSEKRQMNLLLVGGVGLLAAALGTAAFLMKAKDRGTASAPRDANTAPAAGVTDVPPVVSRPRKSDVDLVAEAEPVVRKFMEAESVDQLLPIIRHPDITGPRLKEFYPDGRIAAAGLAKFNATDGLSRVGNMISMSVLNSKFEQRELVLFDTAEGVKIDWESWVGWSAMPWEEFRASKPQTPTLFRATLGPVAYYNFGFTDDAKWQSYRLISPDGEQAIYGYVEKGSALSEKVRLDPDVKKLPITLLLRFPAGATTDNQVEIVGFVADGWVEGEGSE